MLQSLQVGRSDRLGEPATPGQRQPMRRSLVLTCVGARTSFAGEPGGVSPIINPASTSANMAEKAALRVALDAPLSRTARWTASTITAKPRLGIVMADRSSF